MRLACLNHAASVQAEPGSNSSIVFLGPPQSRCDTWNPGCISGALAPSDTFVGWVILEEEFVHRSTRVVQPRKVNRLLLPHRRLRRVGTVENHSTRRASPPAKRSSMQGSKHLLAARDAHLFRRSPGDSYSNKMTFRRRQASAGRDHFLACTAKTF